MPGKKKKFIDKRNAVTFHLVHRSQRDPLQADDDASQRVLLQAGSDKDPEQRLEEQRKFGVFYDDDYDYLQHLRDMNEIRNLGPGDQYRLDGKLTTGRPGTEAKPQVLEPGLTLPSSVFASEVETEIGLLNKAVRITGPQPDWDPDIVAGLDEDFNFDDPDNLLDDDFILKANVDEPAADMGPAGQDKGVVLVSDDDDSDVASDCAELSEDASFGDFPNDQFEDEETKSRFTNYSLSSSVMHRNQGLTLLDDRFEKLYEQYDDVEIGALDHEDIEGGIDQGNHLLSTLLDQFEQQQAVTLQDVVEPGEALPEEDSGAESGHDDDLIIMVIEEPEKKWDCESVLSTYSNLYNHPKLIEEPKKERIVLTSKLGIPSGVLEEPGLSQRQLEREMREARTGDHAPTYRPRDETTEEKKARKQAVKAERKERRAEKKSNKVAFNMEEKRQAKESQNLRQNLQGLKIS